MCWPLRKDLTNRQTEKDYGLEEHRVSHWQTRWHEFHEQWKQLDPKLRPKMSAKLVRKWLADAGGRGVKPMIPGFVEKREYKYERHGTTCLFGNLNVATGKMIAPILHATRLERIRSWSGVLGRVYTINMGYLGRKMVKLGCIQSLQKYIFSSQNHAF